MATKKLKLNKSMIALLRSAIASPYNRCSATISHGNGPGGGHRKLAGGREWDAGCKLANAGLLSSSEPPYSDRETRSGWSMHYTTAVWTITDAGRAALAEYYGHDFKEGETLILVTPAGNESVRVTDTSKVGEVRIFRTMNGYDWVKPESLRRPNSMRDGGMS